MRKVRKLVISRETLRDLTGEELKRVAGGDPRYCKDCGGGDETGGCDVVTTGGGTNTCQTCANTCGFTYCPSTCFC